MENKNFINEEVSRIQEIMFGKNLLNENYLGNLTRIAVTNTIKASIDNVMDDFVKQALKSNTKTAMGTAKFVIDNVATKGVKGAMSVAKTSLKVYDDVAKKAFNKSYKDLDESLKITVKNQVRTAMGDVNDDVMRAAKNQLDNLGGKTDDVIRNSGDDVIKKTVGDSEYVRELIKRWKRRYGKKAIDRATLMKWAKRGGITLTAAYVLYNLMKDENEPTRCSNPEEYWDEQKQKCVNQKTPVPPIPIPVPIVPKYENCTDFPYKKGCSSSIVAEVQKCLGLSDDGKFGPKTEQALVKAGYGSEITKEVYDKIKTKCSSNNNTTVIDPNTADPSKEVETETGFNEI